MPSFEYDFQFFQAGLEQMESYILAKDIYRPVGVRAPQGETPYPQLTLGNLLLAKKRAEQNAQGFAQSTEITRLHNELEALRSRWRSAWGNKANAEFRSRLKLWGDFFSEYRQHPEAHHDRYPYEVSRRVILELLSEEVIDLPLADEQLLHLLDDLLKEISLPGPFLWEENLKPAFPAETFWYLYRSLSGSTTSNPD